MTPVLSPIHVPVAIADSTLCENNVDLVIASHELEGNINGWDFLHIVKKDKPLVHTILLHKFVKYYLCKIDHIHQQPVVLAPLEHYINNINKKAA